MKLRTTLFCLGYCLLLGTGYAQDAQVMGSSAGNSGDYAFVVGQVISGTSADGSVAQGFEQPFMTVTSNTKALITSVNLKLFPNPVATHLNISLEAEQAQATEAYLLDATGKIVKEASILKEGDNTLDFRPFPNGSYQLIILSGDRKDNYTIIKNH